MHAREGRDILQLRHGIGLPHHHVADLQRPQTAAFKNAIGREHMPGVGVAFGDFQRDAFAGLLEVQHVIAGGQIAQFKETVSEIAGLYVVGHVGAIACLEQRVLRALGGVVQSTGQSHLHRVPGGGVDDGGLRNAAIAVPGNLPAITGTVTVTHVDVLNVRQGAEVHAAGGIGLEAEGARGLEVAVLHGHGHGTIRFGLAVFAQHIERVMLTHPGQVHVFQLQGCVHGVDRVAHAVGQVLLVAGRKVVHLRAQGEGQFGQLVRHSEIVHVRLTIGNLRHGHFQLRGHALAIGGLNDQPHVLEHLHGDGLSVQAQHGPHDQLRARAGDQCLAVHVHTSGEVVAFAKVIKIGQRTETVVTQHNRLAVGSVAVGHHNQAILAHLIFRTGKPQRGVGARLVVFVEHAELMPRRAVGTEQTQGALAHQRAAAAAVADKFHHIHAALL